MNSIKEKLLSVEFRTRAFIPTLIFSCLISIFLYWALLVGFQFMGQKKAVQREIKPNLFASIVVEAKSAFVWDAVNQRTLYEKNADLPRPLASLTKVMTAVTASSMAPELRSVTIKLTDLSPEGDSKLKVASIWDIKNLIDYVLLVSSNDGAHALAASVGAWSIVNQDNLGAEIDRQKFIKKMNVLAGEIGLTGSTFRNEHGLDTRESQGGAYGSARDMALLFEYAIKNYPHLLEATRYSGLAISDLQNDNYLAENTNEVINFIPSPIASKTGYTELAGGNLVVAFDSGLGSPIIISVLGSSEKGRFKDVLTLVDTTMKYLQNE